MATCSISSCSNPHNAKGYCQKHYLKLKKYGDPLGGKTFEKHSKVDTKEYRIWSGMKTRCYNPKATYYLLYGGRGITICNRWKDSFSNFYNDMGKMPSEFHSIDRINPDGNYEPTNCRWANVQEQALNHRLQSNNKSGYRGITYNKGKGSWRVLLRDRTVGLKVYFGSYKTPEEAAYVRDQIMMQYHDKPIPLNFKY